MAALARVYSIDHDTLAVETPYSEAIVAQFKAIPGCYFDRQRIAWVGPVEAISEALTTIERAKLAFVDREELEASPLPSAAVRTDSFYSYQTEGANEILAGLAKRDAHLLADDMGLGKSLQALRTAEALLTSDEIRYPLVICPAVVVPNWEDEVRKWSTLKPVRLGAKIPKKLGGGRVLTWDSGAIGIVSYDTFRSLASKVMACDFLILDELHYLSSSKSLRSKAVRAYVTKCRGS